jgi:hypothetical protein
MTKSKGNGNRTNTFVRNPLRKDSCHNGCDKTGVIKVVETNIFFCSPCRYLYAKYNKSIFSYR